MAGDTWREIGQYSSAVQKFYAFLLSPDSLICKKIIASWYFLSPIGDFGER
jgi:hypothetical protein